MNLMSASAIVAHGDLASHLTLTAVVLASAVLVGLRASTGATPMSAALMWGGACLAILLATAPPTERWADRTFTGHMVQHLVLIEIVAPLIALAATRHATGRGGRSRRSRRERQMIGRCVRLLGHPGAAPLAAAAFIGVLLLTHLTGIYDRAIGNVWIHHAEHAAYVASAVAVWVALATGTVRSASAAPFGRVAAAAAVIAGTALLGVVLLTAPTPLIDTYVGRLGAEHALTDQRRAAAIMWVGGMAMTLPLVLVTFWRWASHEEAVAQRSEALHDRQAVGSAPARR